MKYTLELQSNDYEYIRKLISHIIPDIGVRCSYVKAIDNETHEEIKLDRGDSYI